MENTIAYRLQYAMSLRKMRNADVVEAAKRLGFKLNTSSVTQYVSGQYEPKQDKIFILSRILDVPELWLMGITPLDDVDGSIGVMETSLLEAFRKLSANGKEHALNIVTLMSDSEIYRKK